MFSLVTKMLYSKLLKALLNKTTETITECVVVLLVTTGLVLVLIVPVGLDW